MNAALDSKLKTININKISFLENALGPGVDFKPLCVDTENGVWCIYASFAPGISLPPHVHTGPVPAFTLSGCWHYAQYPEQPQLAGSYLYEPAGTAAHTFITPEHNQEKTDILFLVFGANVNFDASGAFHSLMDANFVASLVTALAAKQNIVMDHHLSGKH
jgi:quercetin dioxygenase-like cupin family protein